MISCLKACARSALRLADEGHLEGRIEKGGQTVTRTMHPDRNYVAPEGQPFSLPGSSTMQLEV